MDPAVACVATGMTHPAEDPQPPGLGKIGIWALVSKLSGAFAHEVEQLGYGAIWIGGSPGDDLAIVDELLGATESLVVATGIVNIWKDDARTIAAAHRRITGTYRGRFLLGVGVGHPEATSDYARPYKALVDYLDVLDGEGVPVHERALAALGPKVLRLSADRSAGAHPYLTTPEHPRAHPRRPRRPRCRRAAGAGAEAGARRRSQARRALGRTTVKYYLGLTNYVSNLRRLGFTEDDVAGDGSDRLVDELIGHGDAATASERVTAHLQAGADHVPVQLLTDDDAHLLDGLRALAAHLIA